jgi:hypothetical protein
MAQAATKAFWRRLLSGMGSHRLLTTTLVIPVLLTVVACSATATQEATEKPTPSPTISEKETGTNVGDYAPDFSVMTVTGEQLKLSELTRTGDSVLLYFFASW